MNEEAIYFVSWRMLHDSMEEAGKERSDLAQAAKKIIQLMDNIEERAKKLVFEWESGQKTD